MNTSKRLCSSCRKIHLSALMTLCKCGKYFCVAHSKPEDHRCEYDYFKEQQLRLTILNPVIKVDKIPRI